MIVLSYIIIAAITIVLQTSMGDYFSIWFGARPDAILLTTVFLGLYRDRETGLIAGFFLGIFEDILSGGLLGFNALLKGLTGYYTGRLNTGGLNPNMSARFLMLNCSVVFFASIFNILFSIFLVQIFAPAQFLPFAYWADALKTAGLNVIFAPFVISLLRKVEEKVLPSEVDTPYSERS